MKQTSPLDITYCTNQGCLFKGCEIHPVALRKLQRSHPGRMVSVADYSGTCREYIGWLVGREEARNDEKPNKTDIWR